MSFMEEAEAARRKSPFDHILLRLNNMHFKKNPFQQHCKAIPRSKTFTPRASFTRVPTNCSDNDPLVEEVSVSDILITENVALNREVAFSFHAIRMMPLVFPRELAMRRVRLNAKPRGSSGKTLILDLDDTLVHVLFPRFEYTNINSKNLKVAAYEEIKRILKVVIRPYAIKLLQELSEIYEIIIWTAGEKRYANGILDLLDPKGKYISYRMYRESCIPKRACVLKDLRILENRSLSKTVIVDNTISCFGKQLSNGIYVPSFYGGKGDCALEKIMNLLKEIADCKDIPEELDKKIGLQKLYTDYVINMNYTCITTLVFLGFWGFGAVSYTHLTLPTNREV
eukprot:TRINITY_DN2594_c0_g2_i3.p1 TRINITY_DN2594_c0_g2~~TRINITY_DN2594_c0_g2_i3.p1  ORF type:complete len:340 (-),score=62.19 TRINITY_DN2594_c0_g2_i3:46-1065(-)